MSTSVESDTQIKAAIVEDEGIRASLAMLICRAPPFRLAGDYPDGARAHGDDTDAIVRSLLSLPARN